MRDGLDDAVDGAERRLTGRETAFWYGFAGVTYVGASLLVSKGLLNWFVGPLWLVVVACAGPALVDRARGRSRSRPR